MGESSALTTTQDHGLVRMIFILSQAEHTVDVVDFLAQGETLERQVLDISPDISCR